MNDDKKSKLAELANRKRKEAEEAKLIELEKARAAKRSRFDEPGGVDFGDSDEDEALNEEPRAEQPEQDTGAVATAPRGEDDEGPLFATAEDNDFIDDTGVAPEERIDFGDDEFPEGMYEEAEEAEEGVEDEIDRLFGRRQRRETGTDAENRALIENLLAQMEVAVEEDIRAFEEKKPALNKLRMLNRVEEAVAMKKIQGDLLDAGLLGVLKAWIEPMPDATLPNSKIRSSVLQMLSRLPIDCSYEDRKEQLKRSGVGRIVMFLSKLPDELPANRRIARELVEKWSRPILAPRRDREIEEEETARILAARQQRERAAKAAEGPVVDDEDDNPTAKLRPGQPGFRYRAAIPRSAALDYVNKPESKVASLDKKAAGKGSEHKLTKKLRLLGKKSSSRAADVSVEGRDVSVRE